MEKVESSRMSCSYPNCTNKYYSRVKKGCVKKNFYTFPRNKDVLREWKRVCNIEYDIKPKNFRLCEDHFTPKDFANPMSKRLNRNVVPKEYNQVFSVNDHEYLTKNRDTNSVCTSETEPVSSSDVEFVDTCLDKFSFLENIELPTANSNSLVKNLVSRKETLAEIHQIVVKALSNLKVIFETKTKVLKKLNILFKEGRFTCICNLLKNLPYEFIIKNQLQNVELSEKQDSDQDNFLALSLYLKNKKLYSYLESIFSIPPTKTLQHILTKVPLSKGINKDLMLLMKRKVSKLHTKDRICVLLMGEMPLTKGLRYDETCQYFCGYEDLDYSGRSKKEADRALVFMARGLRQNWTQVVGYYFASDTVGYLDLQNVVTDAVRQLQSIELDVVAFVCEQNAVNEKALSLLHEFGGETDLYYFKMNGRPVCVVYDAAHLLVDMKNTLTKCDIFYDPQKGKVAKLKHVEQAYNFDCTKRIYKLLSNIKPEYFEGKENNIAAATAIFSYASAVCIETFIQCGDLPEEAMYTAEFVEMMYRLFKSVNDPIIESLKRNALTPRSSHLRFWKAMSVSMTKWTLANLESDQDVSSHSFIRGWRETLKSISYVWKNLNSKYKYSFRYLYLNRFNLKPLQNLFEKIELYGTEGKHPTCWEFVDALKTELVYKTKDTLYPLKESVTISEEASENSNTYDEVFFSDLDFNKISNLKLGQSTAYISGYLLHKLDIPECDKCRSYLLADWAARKSLEFIKEKMNSATFSVYASDSVIGIVDRILKLLRNFLKDHSNEMKLENTFKNFYQDEFGTCQFCDVHSCHEDLINMCIKLGIYKFPYKNSKCI